MIAHLTLGQNAFTRSRKLRALIAAGVVCFGGHKKLKIYGQLNCSSGKRMKTANRVFFSSAAEAKQSGFRPCGHCMKKEYAAWKKKQER